MSMNPHPDSCILSNSRADWHLSTVFLFMNDSTICSMKFARLTIGMDSQPWVQQYLAQPNSSHSPRARASSDRVVRFDGGSSDSPPPDAPVVAHNISNQKPRSSSVRPPVRLTDCISATDSQDEVGKFPRVLLEITCSFGRHYRMYKHIGIH